MSLALVHLVREGNDEAPFVRFLESCRAHPAGSDHELVLLFKGFRARAAIERHLELAGGPRWLSVPDAGYDVGAYYAAAHTLEHDHLCFVNSFSEILAGGWLARLAEPVQDGRAGLVGASGSWASHLSHLRYYLGLGGPYAVLGDHRRVKALLRAQSYSERGGATMPRREALRWLTFAPFPAQHVRTNAFCVPRAVMLQVDPGRQRDKLDAYRFESGRSSFTREVVRLGLRTLVAGADGGLYEPADWPRSGTYWQGDQENLLVADNQTRAYDRGEPDVRAALAGLAWGRAAEPAAAGR